jgi:hypothetical protein
MSGLVEDYASISEETINNTIIKKDDFVILFYNGNIIIIKNNIKSTFGFESVIKFILYEVKFDPTKGVIRNCKSKDRQPPQYISKPLEIKYLCL